MKIFCDTEFTNFIDTELISIGLVSENGNTFYAEVDFDIKTTSIFVQVIVIPLLSGLPKTPKNLLKRDILTWLESIREGNDVEICIDYKTDWDLFIDALDYQVPGWLTYKNIKPNIDNDLLIEYFNITGLAQHHALNDALANKFAYRETL